MKSFWLQGVGNTLAGIAVTNGSDYAFSTTGNIPNISTLASWNTLRTAGTISRLNVKIKTNTRSVDSTFRLTSSVGLNSIATAPTATTGFFVDNTNSDVITANTDLRVEGAVSGTGAINITAIGGILDVAGSDYVSVIGSLISLSHSATTVFAPFSGATSTANATEGQHQLRASNSATIRNLSIRVYTNTRTADDTIRVRDNGIDTAIVAVIPAGVTGVVTDLVNTASVVNGDLLNFSATCPTNSGSLGMIAQVEIVGTKGVVGGNNTTNPGFASGVTGFLAVTGAGANTYTQPDTDLLIPMAITAEKFRVRVNTNSANYASTLTLQRNGVDTAIQLVVPAGTTGWIEDTTSTLSVAQDDKLNWKIVNGTGTGTVAFNGFYMDYAEPAVVTASGGETYLLMGVG